MDVVCLQVICPDTRQNGVATSNRNVAGRNVFFSIYMAEYRNILFFIYIFIYIIHYYIIYIYIFIIILMLYMNGPIT